LNARCTIDGDNGAPVFEVNIEGLSELETAWGRVVNRLRQSAARGVILAVKEGAHEARSRHSFRSRSGALEKSIHGVWFGWTEGATRFTGVIRATAKHAGFVEYDTKPHIITVRSAAWLHWEEPQGDHHFAKVVHHPGTRGQPFMHLAYFKAERVLMREAEIAAAEAQGILDA
jgi:hypothetical protein